MSIVPQIIPATVLKNPDGTYAVRVQHTLEGNVTEVQFHNHVFGEALATGYAAFLNGEAKVVAEIKKVTGSVDKDVEKVLADAKTEADKLVADAGAEAEKIVADAKAEAAKVKEAADGTLKTLAEKTLEVKAEAEKLIAAAKAEVAKIEAAAKTEVKTVKADVTAKL